MAQPDPIVNPSLRGTESASMWPMGCLFAAPFTLWLAGFVMAGGALAKWSVSSMMTRLKFCTTPILSASASATSVGPTQKDRRSERSRPT